MQLLYFNIFTKSGGDWLIQFYFIRTQRFAGNSKIVIGKAGTLKFCDNMYIYKLNTCAKSETNQLMGFHFQEGSKTFKNSKSCNICLKF